MTDEPFLPAAPPGAVDWLGETRDAVAAHPKILDTKVPKGGARERQLLRELLLAPPRREEKREVVPRKDMTTDDLRSELQGLYQDLERYGVDLDVADQAQKMGYFRTKFGILREITDLLARIEGLNQVQDFQKRVIGILEDVMTTDQRTEIMGRLGK